SSLSEGLADTLAASITHDSGMGRGFFLTNAPLRELNPTVKKTWDQIMGSEAHDEGEVIAEALWDLRMGLESKLGADAGDARLRKIYYGIMQRASDIPSSYAEALVADDNDGDLSNGTPNGCVIKDAFNLHTLADPTVVLGLMSPEVSGNKVSMT